MMITSAWAPIMWSKTMNKILYTNHEPVLVGDVVHLMNRPYTIDRLSGDYVMLRSMDERREFKAVYPAHIGAYIQRDKNTERNLHLHPIFQGMFK